MIKAILWDIDGTLVDSEPLHEISITNICAAYGVQFVPERDYPELFGRNARANWSYLHHQLGLPMQSPEEWIKAAAASYIALVPQHLKPRPGAIEMLDFFAEQGLLQAAVSNGERAIVDANLASIMAERWMQLSVSTDDVRMGKPSPEPYLLAAALLGLKPEECAVIEDSPTGAESGRAAGMLVIGWPQRTSQAIDAAHLIAPVDSLAALDWPKLLQEPLRKTA